MILPSAPNSISILQIRNEFTGKTVNGVAYGTSNTNLFNLNYYRSKYYYTNETNGTIVQFPTTASSIDMNVFRGKASVCACDCVCVCGDCP